MSSAIRCCTTVTGFSGETQTSLHSKLSISKSSQLRHGSVRHMYGLQLLKDEPDRRCLWVLVTHQALIDEDFIITWGTGNQCVSPTAGSFWKIFDPTANRALN